MKLFHTIADLHGLGDQIWATVGFFDGVHRGHQELLSGLSRHANEANACSLAITFSNLPRAFHQPDIDPKYLTLPKEKLMLLRDQGIDAVLMLEYDSSIANQSAAQFIASISEKCNLRGLCVGYDSTLGNDMLSSKSAFQTLADSTGISVGFAAEYRHNDLAVKSSTVRTLVEDGNIRGANHLLNHPYFVLGEVVHGKGKGGKLLNTPTANLVLHPSKLSPPTGVYACTCKVEGTTYSAATAVMSHIMSLSTPLDDEVTSTKVPSQPDTIVVEANLDGFSGNLYGKQIRLEFHQRLRDWEHFNSTAELLQQIQTDIEETRKVCSVYL